MRFTRVTRPSSGGTYRPRLEDRDRDRVVPWRAVVMFPRKNDGHRSGGSMVGKYEIFQHYGAYGI